MGAALLAVDPKGLGGISVRSAPGPVRDRWVSLAAQLLGGGSPLRKIPLGVCDSRLLGGLDLAATLRAGRPVAERGILAEADGGVVVLSMAERLSASVAAKISAVLDSGELMCERDGVAQRARTRFAVLALDEGMEPDERPPTGLLDRLALHLDLNGLPCSAMTAAVFSEQDILSARAILPRITESAAVLVALSEAATAVGIDSARPILFALRLARAFAALGHRTVVSEADAAQAARLAFAPRAIRAPPQSADAETSARESGRDAERSPLVDSMSESATAAAADALAEPAAQAEADPLAEADRLAEPDVLKERVLEAVSAALPPQLMAHLYSDHHRAMSSRHYGRAGVEQSSRRGRPAGTRAGDWRSGVRVNVIETLRAAAPWQLIRQRSRAKTGLPALPTRKLAAGGRRARAASSARRLCVHKEDLRILRFKRQRQLTTIFLVDASGSAALNRMAEVKGAVELMLAQSYVHRDRVALIAFRGIKAQLLLPPTNSLVRAKRELTRLPAGGGTPLAAGLDAARLLADSLQRRGEAPVVVILTDGQPNVTRDGRGSRAQAEAETLNAARQMRGRSIAALMVDTAPQPRRLTERFAQEMGARYLPLPQANAGMLAVAAHQCRSNLRGLGA